MRNEIRFQLTTIAVSVLMSCGWVHYSGEETPDEKDQTLETEDISVTMEGRGIWIQITPIDESILRYCTEDTRNLYRTILSSHLDADLDTTGTVFLYQYQGRDDPEIRFDPTDVDIMQQAKRYKPLRIIPHTPGFDQRILPFYGTPQMALYVYPEGIDFEFPMTFRYDGMTTDDWDDVIQRIDDARTLFGSEQ
jgi:hypothetical protein